jgi:hypothetical protein
MPRSIRNTIPLTLRTLIQNTKRFFPNRFEYRARDSVHVIRIERVTVYGGGEPGTGRTTYRIRSRSWPQYWPYYVTHDRRGRRHRYQRTTKHEYEVTIQMDKLSIDDTRFKIRTGLGRLWDFTKAARPSRDKRGTIIESKNVERGINGDHFFRLSWIRKQAGVLYGQDYTNGPPLIRNPKMIQFLTKHEIGVIRYLMRRGILKGRI